MSLENHPFVRYNEEKKTDTFTVRMNKDERAMLEEIKELLNVAQDSKALKIAARVGLNVLHGTFTKEILQYLFKKDRRTLEDEREF